MTDEQLLEQITKLRARNNVYWMELVRIALAANPKDTKAVLGKILIMDLEVGRLMRAMAVEDWKERDLDENRNPNDKP